jgi:hypothetical protein
MYAWTTPEESSVRFLERGGEILATGRNFLAAGIARIITVIELFRTIW